MIEFAKMTGSVEDNLLEVRMRTGECLYAPFAIVGAGVPIPSEKWINDNKDNFLALVSYEKDLITSPIIMGFFPVKGADSKSYDVTEKLLELVGKLVEQLLKAKVNTQIGPQPFMSDTISVLNQIKKGIDETNELILPINL